MRLNVLSEAKYFHILALLAQDILSVLLYANDRWGMFLILVETCGKHHDVKT